MLTELRYAGWGISVVNRLSDAMMVSLAQCFCSLCSPEYFDAHSDEDDEAVSAACFVACFPTNTTLLKLEFVSLSLFLSLSLSLSPLSFCLFLSQHTLAYQAG